MLRNLDDFKYYVNCYIDFITTLSELKDYHIDLEKVDEVECFIGGYSEMLSKLLGLEECTDDFRAFQNLIYGKYDNEYQLNEAIEYFWNTSIRKQPLEDYSCAEEQKPKVHLSVGDSESLSTGHTGSISPDFDWEKYFNDLLELQSRFFGLEKK